MNVIQRPRTREFCATLRDYIIDTDAAITFAVQYGGKTILQEEYVPDGHNQVRIRRLGRFCQQALWGVWSAGETSWQPDAAGDFTFLIDGEEDLTAFVMYSRLQTGKDPQAVGVLSEVPVKVTRPGVPEYASGYPVQQDGGSIGYTLQATLADGTVRQAAVPLSGGSTTLPATIDASYDRIVELLDVAQALAEYTLTFAGGSVRFLVDASRYADIRTFRYKNVYDMPETLSCTGGLTLKGNNEADQAAMWGIQRKFAVRPTDEYTVSSGVIFLQSEYKLWHNLLNAAEVQIYHGGAWLPVVITQQELERDFRRSALKTVQFTFQLADATQSNLIE